MLYMVIEAMLVFIVTYAFFKVAIYTPLSRRNKDDSPFYALFMLGLKLYIAFCASLILLNKCKDILYDIRFINSSADDYLGVWLNSIIK